MEKGAAKKEIILESPPQRPVVPDNVINRELTAKLQRDPKFVAFNKWAADNGAHLPRVI